MCSPGPSSIQIFSVMCRLLKSDTKSLVCVLQGPGVGGLVPLRVWGVNMLLDGDISGHTPKGLFLRQERLWGLLSFIEL